MSAAWKLTAVGEHHVLSRKIAVAGRWLPAPNPNHEQVLGLQPPSACLAGPGELPATIAGEVARG